MKPINLYLANKPLPRELLEERNGDYTIKKPISAKVEVNKNGIWYATIELTLDSIGGEIPPKESIFKLDTNILKDQLFMIIYTQEDKVNHTVKCYASHVWFNAQKEAIVFDLRVVGGVWEDAVAKANEIIETAQTVYPYVLHGTSNPEATKIIDEIEDDEVYEILFANDTTKTIAVRGNKSADNTPIVVKTNEHEKSQRYYFSIDTDGSVTMQNCSSDKSVSKHSTGSNYNAVISELGKNDYEKWVIEKEGDVYYIRNKVHNTRYLYAEPIKDRTVTLSNLSKSAFIIKNAKWIQTAYWERKNVIDCIFGSEDNSMVNRWAECKEFNYVAMPDNFDMYFGDSSAYPDNLKPQTIYFKSSRSITEFTKTISMEDVVTGLIPKGYDGKLLPNNEILKGDMYDKYMIHRNAFVEYGDIRLIDSKTKGATSDDDDDAHVYSTEKGFHKALKRAGLRDLNSDRYRLPKVTYTLKIADIKDYDIGNALTNQTIKINDVLVFIDRDSNETIKFTLSKIVYNLLTETNESFTLEGN